MRAYVLTDRSLSRHAGQFVWLAINGEKATNAAFLRKYRIPGYPTYFIVDGIHERALTQWVGGATVAQLHTLFDEQSAAWSRRMSGTAFANRADAELARADSLYGASEYGAAAAAYGAALAAAPATWPQRARAVDARLFALSEADSAEACVELALAQLPSERHTSWSANIAGNGLGCALQLPRDDLRRAKWIRDLESAAHSILADTTIMLSGDDRSGLYISLLDARDDADDSLGHLAVAQQWSAFLDGEAAKAKTPTARMVYDPHRLSAYIEIGHPERAIPMLEQSERDFPDDYNPPARLAIAYREMKEWDKGLEASDRAMARAYGPRKLTFYQTRADLYAGKGDLSGARKTLEDAIAFAEALPDGQRSPRTIASLQKRLDGLK